MKLVSVKQMRDLDYRTINDFGTPGEVLMERAGTGAVRHLLSFLTQYHSNHIKRLVFLAGKGNNGGDAYVMARDIVDKIEAEVLIYAICPIQDLDGDALLNAQRLPGDIEVTVKKELCDSDFAHGDIIIDGLLGTGISGPLRPPYDNWIKTVNQSPCPVIALDIPSGMNGDDGEFATDAINADLTISMGCPKIGFTKGYGPERCGILKNVAIGIPGSYLDETESDCEMTFENDIRRFIVKLSTQSHKMLMGKILVIGGSDLYKGAPMLTGRASLRSGAGLVTVLMPETSMARSVDCNALIVQGAAGDGKGVFTKSSLPLIKSKLHDCDTVIIGPGLSSDSEILPILQLVAKSGKRTLFDADALNLFASYPSLWVGDSDVVVTPHPGEMRRLLTGFKLTECMDRSREEQAQRLAEVLNATVVLKGHQSIIASPGKKLVYNSSGSPALATAGSGDVLSGMIGYWMCHNSSYDAAVIATFIHGLAGELSPFGHRGLIADDLIDLIPEAMRIISPFA